MAGVSVGDVIRVGGLAWEVYRLGWTDEHDASQQYQEFGNDIKSLAENLNHISEVVKNARLTWANESRRLSRNRGPISQRDWNLLSLNEIIGDYHRTLLDCKKLLEENYEYRKNRNVAYNIGWNVVIQPKVDHLRKRLESHNSKIAILLKPLELNLLADIHHDLAARIDAVHQSVLHLQGLLIPDVEQAISEQGRVVPIPLQVPQDIERKFLIAAEKLHPEVRTPGKFPLQAGADAFVTHFEQSTKAFSAGRFVNQRTPPPKQYLELLKCVWIINGLLESDALANTPEDSQWPGYVNQLYQDLSNECQRFTAPSAQCLNTPVLASLRRDDEYEIWPEEDIAAFISPHHEVCLEELLRIPMPSTSPSIQRVMSLYRLGSTKLRLVESVEDVNSAASRRQDYKMEIDLKTFSFTPIYATPSSRAKALEVLIKTGSTQTNPTFQEAKHIFRLQHLLTGYKVYERYDQAMVTVSSFVAGKEIVEHGRLQLWLPHPFSHTTPSSPSPSTVQSSRYNSQVSLNLNSTIPVSPVNPGSSSRDNVAPSRLSVRTSRASLSSVRYSTDFPLGREHMTPGTPSLRTNNSRHGTHAPSVKTTSSSMSRSTVTSTTTISTGTGRANLHTKPAKPLLVIFLKSQDASAKLAIAAIQIDDMTVIERQRCQCRTANAKCLVSCIERSEGCLKVQRWNADQGLDNWNLAKLGTDQKKELPADAWNDVKRVSLKFDSFENRYKFAGGPCRCKPKMQHELSDCIMDRHQGTFGVVKQIGSQRLKNYHNDRDHAATRSMVLGALPEGEEPAQRTR